MNVMSSACFPLEIVEDGDGGGGKGKEQQRKPEFRMARSYVFPMGSVSTGREPALSLVKMRGKRLCCTMQGRR